MTWAHFNWLGPLAIIFWGLASWAAIRRKSGMVDICMAAGIGVLLVFIAGFWANLGRPPMRTMGETRLWYSFFLAGAGFLAYRRWKYPWLLAFSCLMAAIFALINMLRPEIHSIALMPALQSYYFVPHVTAYMLSYAILAVSAMAGVIQLRKIGRGRADPQLTAFTDNLVYIGLGFLMLGLISGAAWAKEAWGDYWSWDPKETWAFITAAAYLIYIHLRLKAVDQRVALAMLPLAFVLLMITWLGVSYLPSASDSVHVYS